MTKSGDHCQHEYMTGYFTTKAKFLSHLKMKNIFLTSSDNNLVLLSIRYGFYGDCHMVLEPRSSRLLRVSSLFVNPVEVRNDGKKGVSLDGFSEKPELSVETKWNLSKFVIVGSYSYKGISLWLNKGSRIRIKWEAQSSILSQLEMSLTKGERKLENIQSTYYSGLEDSKGTAYGLEAAYRIEENDRYNIGIINSNPKTPILLVNVNISSTMYDVKKAERVAIIITCLIMKSLGSCHDESYAEDSPVSREVTETDPILPQKVVRSIYGTCNEEEDCGRSSSSEDLYDGRICVICYDNPRNCFFVPCGHCVTCQKCALRIMNAESKLCPVCRRPTHEVRKFIVP
ncbi:hypothetical protein BC332_08211 [Capsicum chinense]|nr:hypothetical protein BC332_08211 [Capsicum chinense]